MPDFYSQVNNTISEMAARSAAERSRQNMLLGDASVRALSQRNNQNQNISSLLGSASTDPRYDQPTQEMATQKNMMLAANPNLSQNPEFKAGLPNMWMQPQTQQADNMMGMNIDMINGLFDDYPGYTPEMGAGILQSLQSIDDPKKRNDALRSMMALQEQKAKNANEALKGNTEKEKAGKERARASLLNRTDPNRSKSGSGKSVVKDEIKLRKDAAKRLLDASTADASGKISIGGMPDELTSENSRIVRDHYKQLEEIEKMEIRGATLKEIRAKLDALPSLDEELKAATLLKNTADSLAAEWDAENLNFGSE